MSSSEDVTRPLRPTSCCPLRHRNVGPERRLITRVGRLLLPCASSHTSLHAAKGATTGLHYTKRRAYTTAHTERLDASEKVRGAAAIHGASPRRDTPPGAHPDRRLGYPCHHR